VLILSLGILYVRLLQGPLSLGFLTSHIEEALADELGLGVHVEGVAARLNDGGTVEFELRNVRVSDAAGTPLAFASSAALQLSGKALLAGRIAPESVSLNAPRLLLYYGEDGALSVKFSPSSESAEEAAKTPPLRGTTETATAQDGSDWTQSRIDLVKTLTEASASARRREHVGAYLREVGLKSATVILDNGDRKSIWRLLDLDIDLDHRRSRSSIAGRARIESLSGPWEMHFRTVESANAKTLQLKMSVQGLVPRGLARSVPELAMLEGIDLPLWAEAQLDLSSAGEVLGGTIGIDAAPGTITLPWLGELPLRVEGGHFALSYNKDARRFQVEPSVLVWGDSRIQFTGQVVHTVQGPEGPRWIYELKSAGGWIGAEPPVHPRLDIDDWRARGFLMPERGRVVLGQFSLRAGGADVSAQGEVSDIATGAQQARLEGKIGTMSSQTLKALWPAVMAPKSRSWIAGHLSRGTLQGGTFKVTSDGRIAGSDWTAGGPYRASLSLEGSDLALNIVEGWPALELPRSLLRLDGANLEVNSPDGFMVAPDGRRMAVKGVLNVDMRQPEPRMGVFTVRTQGPLSQVLEMIDREPFHVLHGQSASLEGVDGKVDSQLTVSLPLGVELAVNDVKVEGKARVSEGRLKQVFGPYDVTGANLSVDLTGTAVESKGEMLINGVLAKANWQHIFGAPPDKQPAMRVTANLDNSDRSQLGLEINDLVQGEIGVELLVSHNARDERSVQMRADLVNAEVILDSIAWRKPKGKPTVFQFDVIKGGGKLPTELHNVKLVGENVAVEGWMGIGPDNKLKEFRFPQFSLNVVGSLDVQGRLRPDNVWDVTAKGPTYDGRDIFRAFFDINRSQEAIGKARPGLDLRAEIDTVIGFYDASMRNVRVNMQKRGDKLVALDSRGSLEGGKVFAAQLKPEPGQPRRLRAESTDAGQLFKLVGFYPNAVGGQMRLEVNLDGKGPAERTGTLWANDFYLLGDPVVSELFQATDGSASNSGGGRKTVVREKFEFERMRVPFSVGHGQFVISGASLNGPLVGATIRGTVDFKSQKVQLGGTYIPLSGLNNLLAPVPIFGPLLTGPRGEGIFGITFAIQGDMNNPQVIVNPLSLITPGIFREIMQMTPDDPSVQVREKGPARDNSGAARASSTTIKPTTGGGDLGTTPDIGAGWSAEATDPTKIKKK
jgi:AsmA-like C-terminal region/Protein of unknown function